MQENEARQDAPVVTGKSKDMSYVMFQTMFLLVGLSPIVSTIFVGREFFYLAALPLPFAVLTLDRAFSVRTTRSILPWLASAVIVAVFFR